ncbi:hypothetical protein [Vibrio coralliirubri]|uniref:hypothetical protein n=1 Tax=Vibrio coralliirubri TaxID=1516159 RepID=UPI002FE04702
MVQNKPSASKLIENKAISNKPELSNDQDICEVPRLLFDDAYITRKNVNKRKAE